MKLLIIATLIAVAASARVGNVGAHSHQFLQLMQTETLCGIEGDNVDISQCGCQKLGCAYDNNNNQCVPNTGQEDSAIWSAHIMGACHEAHSEDACLSHKAWTNQYGGKTDCSWCSGMCVAAGHADTSCMDSASGGYVTLYEWRASYTISFDFWPQEEVEVCEPAPEPEPVVETPEVVEEVIKRTCDEGYCSTDSAFSATLAWNNCNDLDLHMFTPYPAYSTPEGEEEQIWYGNTNPTHATSSGASLDIDYHAGGPGYDFAGQYDGAACPEESNKPVENIRWPGMEVPAAPGIYTIKVKYYKSWQGPDTHTPYTLVVWDGYQHHIQQNDGLTFAENSEDYYYFIVTEDSPPKLCFSYDRNDFDAEGYVCDPANNAAQNWE